jgi:hypothetical protein
MLTMIRMMILSSIMVGILKDIERVTEKKGQPSKVVQHLADKVSIRGTKLAQF